MQKRFYKYFWDGLENRSPEDELKRILEYASFPDLIKYPFTEIKDNLNKLNIQTLRTSDERIEFIDLLLPYVESSENWEDAIWKMVNFRLQKNLNLIKPD